MAVAANVSQLENLCCHELSPSRKRLLRKFSPHRYPQRWLFINVIVLIWSIILFSNIVGTRNDNNENDERTTVELEYLVYNFGTSAIWALEVGLNIFDYTDTKEEGVEHSLLEQPAHSITDASETIPLWIEFSLAVYFVIDSAAVVFHLTRKEVHHLANGMLLDVVINMLAYFYLVYRQFVDWRKSNLMALSQNEHTDAEAECKGVFISYINYDGQVKRSQSDEYVVITNDSNSSIDISGYSVLDINHHGTPDETEGNKFTFPYATVLTPGESVRIYTNEIHAESGGYSFRSKKAIWNNNGGKVVLKDRAGKEISKFVYP